MVGDLDTTRSSLWDRVMLLVSMKAGLHAKAIASLTWAMVTDAEGQIAEAILLQNRASKGKTGGRTMPQHPDLQTRSLPCRPRPKQAVLFWLPLRIGTNIAYVPNGIKLSSNAPLINVLHVARCDRVAASGIGSACDGAGFDMGRSPWQEITRDSRQP